jgi:hypothetical protein
MMALPITTSGCRALLERRAGRSTRSGSIAVRALRGAKRLGPDRVESVDAAGPAGAPGGREFGTAAGAGEDRGGATARLAGASPGGRGRGGWAAGRGADGLLAAPEGAAGLAGFTAFGGAGRAGAAAGLSGARAGTGREPGAGRSPPSGGFVPVTAVHPHSQAV